MECGHAGEVVDDMLILHVPKERTELDIDVQRTLEDLVVAHTVKVSDHASIPVGLPAIEDGGTWVPAAEFPSHVGELARIVHQWRRFQSDACYIDDDGTVC